MWIVVRGEKLRELRVARNVTRAELTQRAKVSRWVLWRAEKDGTHRMREETLHRLAVVLGMKPDELLHAVCDGVSAPSPSEAG